MSQTIEIQNITLGKNPCATSEPISIQVKAVFIGTLLPDEPTNLPFDLPFGLGGGEF